MKVLSLLFHDVYRDDPSESGFLGPAADRYKLTVGQFDRQLAGLARVRSDRPILVTDLLRPTGTLLPFAITVDDGGVTYYTTVAERLERLGWRGHCFVTTGRVGQRGFLDQQQIRDLHGRGHLIGSHSVSHPARFSACGWNEMLREWEDSRKALADIIGQDVAVASVPGGYYSRAVANAACQAGFRVLFTSEPRTRLQRVAGCQVMGRFTVRPRHRTDFARDLGMLDSSTLVRESIVWNIKKVAKALLGHAHLRSVYGRSA
jgi:peptidoglycan/xylan/chitin deacetylase (PgdA/CDA1 family)